jgi:hypothetical protein
LFGRAVRWLFGATKQDNADNKKIMANLLHGLKQRYGAEIGVRALIAMVPDARVRGGQVYARTDKPLTARQVNRHTVRAASVHARHLVDALGQDDSKSAGELLNLSRVSGTHRHTAIRSAVFYDTPSSELYQRYRASVRLLTAARLAEAQARQSQKGHQTFNLVETAETLVRHLGAAADISVKTTDWYIDQSKSSAIEPLGNRPDATAQVPKELAGGLGAAP